VDARADTFVWYNEQGRQKRRHFNPGSAKNSGEFSVCLKSGRRRRMGFSLGLGSYCLKCS
jgi:hypothetical protein